jgi:hypothetical protein
MKQTALQELIAWGDNMLLNHPQKTLSFGEAIDKAVQLLEKEKEQIIDAHYYGGCDFKELQELQNEECPMMSYSEKYYNKTYTDDLSDWDVTLNDGLEDL